MKTALEQFLDKKETAEKKRKKQQIKVKTESEIIEVVEKTILVEDGRQLLND